MRSELSASQHYAFRKRRRFDAILRRSRTLARRKRAPGLEDELNDWNGGRGSVQRDPAAMSSVMTMRSELQAWCAVA